jgi:hypothetical protein
MKKSIWAILLFLLFNTFAFSQSTRTEFVKGLILDFEGRPVAGASISVGPIAPLKGVMPMTKSNAHGEFSVVVHQTGQFLVVASKTADGYPSTGNLFYYPHTSTAALVTVLADQPAPYATVQFGPKAGKLLMRISDADTSEPLKIVTMSLCRIEAPKHCHRFKSEAVRDVHTVLAPSAPFTMEVSATSYQSAYGENSRDSEVEVFRIPSDTTKEMIVSMRKGTDDGPGRLPAPRIVSPPDRAILLNVPYPRILTVEWGAVAGAATYTVEVEVCTWVAPDGGECKKGSFPLVAWRQPPPSGIEGTRYEFRFPGTQPGRWRVWAVDAQGRPGVKSPWTLFFYVWRE